jgi:penicillin amidase
LEAKPKLTADDFRAIQGDTFSIPGSIFFREMVRTLKDVNFPLDSRSAEGDRLLKQALTTFQSWDGRIVPESTIAPLIAEMRLAFRDRILKAAIGEELAKEYAWGNSGTFIDRLITEQPRAWLPKDFMMYADLLLACYGDARAALTKRLGADETQWTWGRYSQVSFPHPLARVPLIGQQFLIPPFPQSGAGANLTTVNVGRSVSMRLIADPGDWDKTQHGITLGQSGLPSSPHWKDQLEDWRNVTPRAFPFTRAAVERATRATIEISPANR